jgi:hypothetical protein
MPNRDCNGDNIMMDASSLYPASFHPVQANRNRDLSGNAQHFTRSEKRPRYVFIDFGLSRRYTKEQRPPSEPIILGGDKSPPEHKDPTLSCDPFPTDVYYLGNMIRRDFIDVRNSRLLPLHCLSRSLSCIAKAGF